LEANVTFYEVVKPDTGLDNGERVILDVEFINTVNNAMKRNLCYVA
jgi:hypothetical protein